LIAGLREAAGLHLDHEFPEALQPLPNIGARWRQHEHAFRGPLRVRYGFIIGALERRTIEVYRANVIAFKAKS
jgi:hypothetical protein